MTASNQKIKIIIDDREPPEIFEAAHNLQNELTPKNINIEFIRQRLKCGDALCGNIVFERKEGDDLVASMCDGRLESQAANLFLNFEHEYYIFVGNIWNTEKQRNVSPRSITGIQHHLIHKYDARILFVPDNTQYIWAIYSIIKRHQEGKTFDPHKHKIIKYKITPSDRFVASLAATGIGKEKAHTIATACNYNMLTLYNIPNKELCKLDGIGDKTPKQIKKVLFNDRR